MVITNNDKKSNESAMEILKDIFENINRWLNFAEAKNGALIGVNGLFLFKSIDYLFEIYNGLIKVNILLVGIIAVLFIIALLLSLKSFFPDTSVFVDKPDVPNSDSTNENRILIFYEDICKYQNSKLYLKDIYKYYLDININVKDLKKIELDYSKEILINSKITSYKCKLFKKSLKTNFVAIIIFCMFIIVA